MMRLVLVALVVSMVGCMDVEEDVAWQELALEGDQADVPEDEGADVVNECSQECSEVQKAQLEVCLVIFPGWTLRTKECRDAARARRRTCARDCGIVSGPEYPYCTLPLPGCPL